MSWMGHFRTIQQVLNELDALSQENKELKDEKQRHLNIISQNNKTISDLRKAEDKT